MRPNSETFPSETRRVVDVKGRAWAWSRGGRYMARGQLATCHEAYTLATQ